MKSLVANNNNPVEFLQYHTNLQRSLLVKRNLLLNHSHPQQRVKLEVLQIEPWLSLLLILTMTVFQPMKQVLEEAVKNLHKLLKKLSVN